MNLLQSQFPTARPAGSDLPAAKSGYLNNLIDQFTTRIKNKLQ